MQRDMDCSVGVGGQAVGRESAVLIGREGKGEGKVIKALKVISQSP